MSRRVALTTLLVLLIAATVSCQPMPEFPEPGQGGLPAEDLARENEIPAAWGRLVAVTNDPNFGHLFQLWFEDTDGSVRMVTYNNRWQQLSGSAVIIRRTGGGQP